MDQLKAVYKAILGNPKSPIVVGLTLPRLGEHDFKYVVVEELKREYYHYGFRLIQGARPVNVQVYGKRKLIEYLAHAQCSAKCELELVVKTLGEREFILVNLYLTDPEKKVTHEFGIVPAPQNRPSFVYTTKDMRGVGVMVRPLR